MYFIEGSAFCAAGFRGSGDDTRSGNLPFFLSLASDMYDDFEDSESFFQTLKIIAVKKLVWNEVVFVEDDEEIEKLSQLITKAFFQNDLLEKKESVTIGKACHNINLIEGHNETAETIFNTLSDVSKQTGWGSSSISAHKQIF